MKLESKSFTIKTLVEKDPFGEWCKNCITLDFRGIKNLVFGKFDSRKGKRGVFSQIEKDVAVSLVDEIVKDLEELKSRI